MPDMGTRAWIRRTAQLFGEPMAADEIVRYAQIIGIQPNRLISCYDKSGTATARRIIRELYTKEELEEAESGVTAVLEARRKAIRGKYYLYDKQ